MLVCALTCLLTQAEIVVLEICRDIKTKAEMMKSMSVRDHSGRLVIHDKTRLHRASKCFYVASVMLQILLILPYLKHV